MSLFWRSSRMNRGRLVRTLYELGPTTIPGLSAALSWSEKRTERLVRELVRTGEGGLFYQPASRRVEIPRVVARPPRAESRSATPHAPPLPRPQPPTPPALSASVLSPRWGGQAYCPKCSGTLEPTATGEALVCRTCGRLSSMPKTTRDTAASVPAPSGQFGDRKGQELFAAYVTSRPVPCPKCKTPLHHRALALYGCPVCGEVVRFPTTTPTPPSAPPPVSVPIHPTDR